MHNTYAFLSQHKQPAARNSHFYDGDSRPRGQEIRLSVEYNLIFPSAMQCEKATLIEESGERFELENEGYGSKKSLRISVCPLLCKHSYRGVGLKSEKVAIFSPKAKYGTSL